MGVKVTVFTPTYNRGYIIEKCYTSLKRQTCKEFEWIIVDDGSTDNTEQMVTNWLKEKNEFNIIYKKTANGGKHRAINKALDIANGRLFFIVDSDDYIVDDAIEKILKAEETIKNSKEKYAGIAMAKGYDDKIIVGTTFKGDYLDATTLEREKYNINGDKAEIFYTDILKQNKFPEFEGEKFLTEAVVWNRIAEKGYKIRWFQDIIYICEYREDGLTKQGISKFKNSPKGLLLFIKEHISYGKLNFLRRCLQYEFYSRVVFDNKNIKQAAEDLETKRIYIYIGILLRKIVNLIRK